MHRTLSYPRLTFELPRTVGKRDFHLAPAMKKHSSIFCMRISSYMDPPLKTPSAGHHESRYISRITSSFHRPLLHFVPSTTCSLVRTWQQSPQPAHPRNHTVHLILRSSFGSAPRTVTETKRSSSIRAYYSALGVLRGTRRSSHHYWAFLALVSQATRKTSTLSPTRRAPFDSWRTFMPKNTSFAHFSFH